MSDWIPAEERANLTKFYRDIPQPISSGYVGGDVHRLIAHAAEADRRISELEQSLGSYESGPIHE